MFFFVRIITHPSPPTKQQVPEALVEFIDRITGRWPTFTSVLPAHFNAPARAGPDDLRRAFAFAYQLTGRAPAMGPKAGAAETNPLAALLAGLLGGGERGGGGKKPVVYPEEDMAVLRFVNDFIKKAGVASK